MNSELRTILEVLNRCDDPIIIAKETGIFEDLNQKIIYWSGRVKQFRQNSEVHSKRTKQLLEIEYAFSELRTAIQVRALARAFAKATLRTAIKRLHPPDRAERLLSFLLPPEKLEEVIGDFEDGYRLMLERHNRGHAQRWYCWQVFMVALRGICEAVLRAAKIWGGFGSA